MKKGGRILSKYRVATYAGRSYIILEGHAGLRSQLKGTRYLASNPKVVSMAIGKFGAAKAIRGGIVISVIFSVGFHAIDQLLNDRATWHTFAAGVTADIGTATLGAALAWSVTKAVVGGAAMTAIGPIAVVVLAGAGITFALNVLSDRYDLSNRLAALLFECEKRMKSALSEIEHEVKVGLRYAHKDPVYFVHRVFGVPYFPVPR